MAFCRSSTSCAAAYFALQYLLQTLSSRIRAFPFGEPLILRTSGTMAEDLMLSLSPGKVGAVMQSTAMTITMAKYGLQLSGEPPELCTLKS